MNSKEGKKIKHWRPRGSNRVTPACGTTSSHPYSTWYRPDVSCKRCKQIMKKV